MRSQRYTEVYARVESEPDRSRSGGGWRERQLGFFVVVTLSVERTYSVEHITVASCCYVVTS